MKRDAAEMDSNWSVFKNFTRVPVEDPPTAYAITSPVVTRANNNEHVTQTNSVYDKEVMYKQ